MTPFMAIVVGLYVATRMVELLTARERPPRIVRGLALVTLCVSVLALIVTMALGS